MKNFKLVRKFMLLAVMFVGIGFVVSTDTSASAKLFCCSDCDNAYQQCINGGGTPSQCFQENRFCFQHCDPMC